MLLACHHNQLKDFYIHVLLDFKIKPPHNLLSLIVFFVILLFPSTLSSLYYECFPWLHHLSLIGNVPNLSLHLPCGRLGDGRSKRWIRWGEVSIKEIISAIPPRRWSLARVFETLKSPCSVATPAPAKNVLSRSARGLHFVEKSSLDVPGDFWFAQWFRKSGSDLITILRFAHST